MGAKIRFESNGMYTLMFPKRGFKNHFAISQLLISLIWWISMVTACEYDLKQKGQPVLQ